MRAFIALPLPEATRTEVERIQRQWREQWLQGKVSWVMPKNFHLTLRFLGDITDRQAKDVAERLPTLKREPIALELTRPLCLPNDRRSVVLTLGATAPPELEALIADLDRALEDLGLDRRDKPFKAHLTLGRVRERAEAGLPEMRPIAFKAAALTLFESRFDPQGTHYEPLKEIALA